jgi:ribosomal protein L44E
MFNNTKKFLAFLRFELRRVSLRNPNRYSTLEASRRPYKGPNKRQKWEYECKKCNKWFMQKEIEVDHITPCGPLTTTRHITPFIKRLFLGELQVLCKACHKIKTQIERVRAAR